MGRLGAILGRSWGPNNLSRKPAFAVTNSWVVQVPLRSLSWGRPGAFLERLGVFLEPLGGLLVVIWVILGAAGRLLAPLGAFLGTIQGSKMCIFTMVLPTFSRLGASGDARLLPVHNVKKRFPSRSCKPAKHNKNLIKMQRLITQIKPVFLNNGKRVQD